MNDDGAANVYLAASLLEAEFLRNVLVEAGIEARVSGVGSIMAGMVPNEEAAPCLWVRRRDAEKAKEILADWEQVHARPHRDDEPAESGWKCSACGETVEEDFELCWNCETPRQSSG